MKIKQTGNVVSTQNPVDFKMVVHLGEMMCGEPNLDGLIIDQLSKLFTCKVNLFIKKPQLQIESSTLLIRKALQFKSIVYLDNNNQPLIYRKTQVSNPSLRNLVTDVAFPIIFRGNTLGAIALTRNESEYFTPKEIDLFEPVATQIAIAIKSQEKVQQNASGTKTINLLQKTSELLVVCSTIADLTEQVNYSIQSYLEVEHVNIYSWDSKLENLITLSTYSNGDITSNSNSLIFSMQNIVEACARSGNEVSINLDTNTRRVKNKEHLNIPKLSRVAFPIKIYGRVLGVIDLVFYPGKVNPENDFVILRSVAALLAMGFENNRLDTNETRRVSLMESVSKVSNAVTSILEEAELFSEVINALQEYLAYPFVQIFSVHTGRRKVFFRSGKTKLEKDILPPDFAYDLDGDSAVSRTARTGEAIIEKSGSGFSTLIVSLRFSDQILGVIEIGTESRSGITAEDQAVLEAVADYIAIAIHNSGLYRSEQWRRKVAESMREIAGLLTTNTDSKQMLQLILGQLEKTLPIDISAIWLLENYRTEKEEQKPFLQLAAVHLSGEFIQNSIKENRFSEDEILQYCQEADLPSPWLMQALDTPSSLIRTIDDPYEPLGAILDFGTDYSTIAAQLRIGDTVIGLLTLAHNTSGRYGHEAQVMTETFASYAAVAIENARLYEAAHDQAWISTILLKVAEATQSLNSLEDLLATMAQLTPTLVGMDACMIFLWDNFREMFMPVKSYGLDSEQKGMFENWWFSLGDVPSIDQMYFSKLPIYITAEEVTNEHPVAVSIKNALNYPDQTLAIFPMVTRGDIIGFFLVSFHEGDADDHVRRVAPDIEWEEKYAITQGIAQQTAVAVENLQLLRAQQEEAYVSVALLQVAQAVVSLNALSDTLETIVRLTPILIGVRRCVIYLWNETDSIYRLAGYYGLSRVDIEEMGSEFLDCEFPFLDSIKKSGQLAVHPVSSETESPINWQFIGQEEIFLSSFESGQSSGDKPAEEGIVSKLAYGFLHSSISLMFGFPLAVKGKVLGVMITQEMDPSSTNFQGRAKRHEISIGIAQQVALAIQNDQLQHEVLERERLEREFQLAREIQETFLPDKLPVIPGWDLKALWQPARQVSGDFYDILELPDNQLGIVIADVADKGMPAALFMTLIRTLIRAAVRENESPASVLNRVNDLLIPDTKHGMFVTVTYFLLNLSTGVVRYANAGHNPPVWIKKAKEGFERLTRTGIALGIFENAEIGEQMLLLEKGDRIIFYTDGITESFSPTDEMYGENKFIELLMDMQNENLDNILERILSSVTDFIGGTNYSDDITLVGVIRYAD